MGCDDRYYDEEADKETERRYEEAIKKTLAKIEAWLRGNPSGTLRVSATVEGRYSSARTLRVWQDECLSEEILPWK